MPVIKILFTQDYSFKIRFSIVRCHLLKMSACIKYISSYFCIIGITFNLITYTAITYVSFLLKKTETKRKMVKYNLCIIFDLLFYFLVSQIFLKILQLFRYHQSYINILCHLRIL